MNGWCYRDLVASLYGSAMGCLFRCFGIRDDRSRPSLPQLGAHQQPPNTTTTSTTVATVLNRNRKRLGMLLTEDKEGSVSEEKKYNLVECSGDDCDFRALEEEAKFLKACGTLPETPAEIQKVSKLLADSPSNGDSNTSIQKLNLEMQAEITPTTKFYDELTGSGSSANTPSSCMTSGHVSVRISTSSTKDSGTAHSGISILNKTNRNTSVEFRSRSIQFDCPSGGSTISSKGSSSGVSCQSSKQSVEAAGNTNVSKLSPYATPLQLSDDMQTPGAVFPSYVRNTGNEKNPRVRSQYVYSVLNPVDNLSPWNLLKEEDSNSNQQSGHLIESLEQADQATPLSEVGMMKDSVKKGFEVEASLSSWLQPVNQNGNNQRTVSFAREKTSYGKNLGDRPIIGIVAAHWTEEEPQRISPKSWDGNGIPNSTTKYKEDQKVSWHATPFEERLEKALSEETSITQRKKNLSGTSPIDFNEYEECDTALSQLKSSTHFSSVVSC